MKFREKILEFKRGTRKGKKYTVIVQDKQTKKTRILHFGAVGYQQYKDRTPLKLYAKYNHDDISRMHNYYSRHSGIAQRGAAINKEFKNSSGYYTPKLLSHIYLW